MQDVKAKLVKTALNFIPADVLASAPDAIGQSLCQHLAAVQLQEGELSAAYMVGNNNGQLRIYLCTLNGQNTVCRVLQTLTANELFTAIINAIKTL